MYPRFLFLIVLLLAGCRNNTGPDIAAPPKKTAIADNKTAIALDIFRQGGERAQLREALNLLNPTLASPEIAPRLVLTPEQRRLLQNAKLSLAELQDLEAVNFSSMDAVVLESASLFRDAARTVQILGLGRAEQAAFAFDWVARHVLFYEQRHEGLPPAYVLRAGHGSPTDRGLVFLALAHQLGFQGCLLMTPEMTEAPLVGILLGDQFLLFDTRLGRLVPGPGGAGLGTWIATWKDVVKNPTLLKDSKITPEQVAAMEARLAVSLESLSPRMKYLEGLLQGEEAQVGGERLATYHDFVAAEAAVKAAGMEKVSLWQPGLRLERQFASIDDGGLDATQRARRFTVNLIPWAPVLDRYQNLRILGDLPREAQIVLIDKLTGELFDRYDRQPGEMLVRGKTEALPRRLERIRAAVDDAEFGSAKDDRELARLAAAWRERVNEAYLALRREPEGEQKVRTLWEEDTYLLFLIHLPDLEDIPRNAVKKALSRLVLAAVREPLAARANWLFAQLNQDKAERLDEIQTVQKAAGRESKSAAANARNAWLNARSAWSQYLDRNNLGPSLYASSLPEIRRHLQAGDAERALSQWEYLQRELHQYAAARLGQARALRRTGQDPTALLEQLARELEQLIDDPTLAKERAASEKNGITRTLDGPRRWALLMRDWGPDGTLAWLRESVRMAKGNTIP